ncbi:MAG: WYL domain-containing protein [Treponema sp.]|jgi:predicted DNA-binding transcriptional regulator YafY|nr:WYL domain-containing protein [Treponema sp.]
MQTTIAMNKEHKVRTNRLLLIDKAIRSGKYPNTNKLAAIAEVNSRTIQRDIEYMRDMFGAPLEYDPVHRGYYYTEENYFMKGVPLTEGELFSIALFDQLLSQYRNTPLEEALRTIFSKIVQCLPDNVSVDTGFLGSQVTFIPDQVGKIDLKAFQIIFEALRKKRTVNFEYRSLEQNEYGKRAADPYHAICQRGNWYFIGHCHERREPRMFAFSRIKNAGLGKVNFAMPAGFNPNIYFDKEMGVWASSRTSQTIELRFDKEIGIYALDRQWHSSQSVKENKDGSVDIKFTTTQIPEVLRWVLGQGRTVKVLRPPELVKMVKGECEKVRGMYG